jgi:hypothetical protein
MLDAVVVIPLFAGAAAELDLPPVQGTTALYTGFHGDYAADGGSAEAFSNH